MCDIKVNYTPDDVDSAEEIFSLELSDGMKSSGLVNIMDTLLLLDLHLSIINGDDGPD